MDRLGLQKMPRGQVTSMYILILQFVMKKLIQIDSRYTIWKIESEQKGHMHKLEDGQIRPEETEEKYKGQLNYGFYVEGRPNSAYKYKIIFKLLQITCNNMSSFFCCYSGARSQQTLEPLLQPQPYKFKLLKSIGLLNPLLKLILLPKKKEEYTFSRQRLFYLSHTNTSHIPAVYFHSNNFKQDQLLLIYCHGSGSTLNNVYNFGYQMMSMFDISVLAYDYSGDGESKATFSSFEEDLKVILAWAISKNYSLQRIILCGFSLGSYSALCIKGPMPRLLISPLCGIIPFIENTSLQYEGELFDNIKNAQKIESRTIIFHGQDQFIPYSHAQTLIQNLRIKNGTQKLQLYKVENCGHLDMPNSIFKKIGSEVIKKFIKGVRADGKEYRKKKFQYSSLISELQEIKNRLKQSKSSEFQINI